MPTTISAYKVFGERRDNASSVLARARTSCGNPARIGLRTCAPKLAIILQKMVKNSQTAMDARAAVAVWRKSTDLNQLKNRRVLQPDQQTGGSPFQMALFANNRVKLHALFGE